MKVRITRASQSNWYHDCIGKVYEVTETPSGENYLVIGESKAELNRTRREDRAYGISTRDCEVIKENKMKIGDMVKVVNVKKWCAPNDTVGMTGKIIEPATSDGVKGFTVRLSDGTDFYYTASELKLVKKELEGVKKMGQTCDLCGKTANELFETTEGEMICKDCIDSEGYEECSDCSKLEKDLTTVDGGAVCSNCLENYQQCHDCDEWFNEDDLTMVHDNRNREVYVCEDCRDSNYSQCNDCGEWVHDDCFNPGDNPCGDDGLCNNCFENGYTRCYDCGNIISLDNSYEDDEGDRFCENCWRNHDRGSIHDYGYKPEPKFHGIGPAFQGVEVEVDNGGESGTNAKKVLDILGDHAYCKHDGSISNGFEVVSHPATLEYHTNNIPWKEALKKLSSMGYKSHDCSTCGLHVHMSRKGFGKSEVAQDLAIAKLLLFFEANWDDIVKFTRRKGSSLDRWAKRYCKQHDETCYDLLDRAKRSDRYYAVNLRNEDTVEIRVFKGTLLYESFIATLQFCEVLRQICTKKSLRDLQEVNFKYVQQYAKDNGYKELVEYIEEKVFVNPEIKLPPFKVGDKVKIIQEGIGISFSTVGKTGTIQKVPEDWEERDSDSEGGFCVELGNGWDYWYKASMLKLISQQSLSA